MAAYSVNADVISEFRALVVTSSSIVTTAELTEFIVQTDNFINGKIGTRFEVPVTSAPLALSILKTISIGITADRVSKILEVKTTTDETKQESEKTVGEKAMDMLDQIASGELLLSDATHVRAGAGVASFNVDNAVKPEFNIQTDQW